MKFLIITGMSGAGKTRAADVLEDMDYYCVDNIPAALLPKLAEFCVGLGGRYEKVAIVTDLRDAGGVSAI
ncbi:MAG: RNase adaptor protein RapZ, partial [Oscillospiraceae bacterium]|nr:RNase adaptor protein RapZ [Oscillospiraceae bacterium]